MIRSIRRDCKLPAPNYGSGALVEASSHRPLVGGSNPSSGTNSQDLLLGRNLESSKLHGARIILVVRHGHFRTERGEPFPKEALQRIFAGVRGISYVRSQQVLAGWNV